ncbi:MAG: hypothetical protein ACREVH_06710 [Gammaproteobacteria bacterium]
MKQLSDDDRLALETLRRAVHEALERKRRLGQYAVVWRGGGPVCIGPDAPIEPHPSNVEPSSVSRAVAESGDLSQ